MQCYKAFGQRTETCGEFNPWHFEISSSIVWHPEGYSAREFFSMWDSSGKFVQTREPYTTYQVISGKKLLNFNIKQWVDGINDGVSCVGELQDDFPWMPDWVWDSIRKQMKIKQKDYEFRWNVELLQQKFSSKV